VGAPFRVVRWNLLVEIQCRQCDKGRIVVAVNTQEAICPECHATYAVGGMRWDVNTRPTPEFAIASSPPVEMQS
jgi:hypothetical protein